MMAPTTTSRPERTVAVSRPMAPEPIGRSVPRHDAHLAVMGSLRHTEDIELPGMLHCRLLRARYPHATILRLDSTRAVVAPGVYAVIVAGDIPHNRLGPRQEQRVLADDRVRYMGDPVAAVAAKSAEAALDALRLIEVEYEELPAVFDPEEALEPGAPILHGTSNLFQRQNVRHGDVERGFAESDLVVEETFRTQFVEHAAIEPQVALAVPGEDGRLTVYSPSSKPFSIQREVARALAIPQNRVRVVGTTSGGGFGGKNEPILEPVVAALAMKTGRPVRGLFTREEEFVASSVRHPFVMRYRSGVTRLGRILAREIRLIADTGAYSGTDSGTSGKTALIKAATMAAGPYQIPNVRVEGVAVYTNHPVANSMRGPGVPQVCFACESHMETIARRLGMDSLEFRMLNAFEEGDVTPFGDTLFSVGLKETMRQAAAAFGWTKEGGK
jgi:nicotinate dehydrogenase large molybdopterin subunit